MKLNFAQQILCACGVDMQVVLLGHYREKNKHNTKRGPGRVHLQGREDGGQRLSKWARKCEAHELTVRHGAVA